MSQAAKDVSLMPVDDSQSTGLALWERLAKDDKVDVDKLEKLMQMQERAAARFSQEQFNTAMSSAQRDMRMVAVDAYNPQTRSKYASYQALDKALRPIYTQHGFGLSFNTGDAPLQDYVRVLCRVTHNSGHAEVYHIDMPADGKGAKGGDVMTKTHATGAAIAYGMRYLSRMIWNVATGEDDQDGNEPEPAPTEQMPQGFESWRDDLYAVAEEGWTALEKAWKASKEEYRDYLKATSPNALNTMKVAAKKADDTRKARS